MSYRERQTPGGSAAAVPRPPELRSQGPAAPLPHWEALFPTLAAAQQQGLLALARRQGHLSTDQLSPASPPADRAPQILNRLLVGHEEPGPPEPVECSSLDRELDAGQRAAVARALATPDLCLIRGEPGTGKCRVAVELIRQVVLRGQRILLLAPTGAGLDHLLGRLAAHPEILALRCLARGERWQTLPEEVRGLTLPGQQAQLRDEALPHARRTIARAEDHLLRASHDEPLLEQLAEVAVQVESAAREVADAEAHLQELPADDRPLPGEWATAAATDASVAQALGEVEGSARQALAKLAAVERAAEPEPIRLTEIAKESQALRKALRPLAEARRNGHWWRFAYWRALFAGDVQARCEECEGRLCEAEQGLEQARQRMAELVRARDRIEAECRAERERTLRRFLDSWRTERTERLAGLRRAADRWASVWDELCGRALSAVRPTQRTSSAVAAAQRALGEIVVQAEEDLNLNRPWAAWLEDHAERLPARLAEAANVVAVTPAALGTPEFLEDATRHGGFDLLLVIQADQIAESDFDQAARRAHRWALFGTEAPLSEIDEPRGPRRNGRAGTSRPRPMVPLFTRLWDALHANVWSIKDGRLTCCLRPVPPGQRHRLETETLADRPEIALRIWAPPGADPVLAEVAFPAGWGLAEALPFLFHELGELPLPTGPAGRWCEGDGALTLTFQDGPGPRARIDLGDGVSVTVHELPTGPAPWHSAALHFDLSAGWTRPRAEEWARERWHPSDNGRTARLDVNYRQVMGLSAVLHHVYQGDSFPRDGSALEFIPVPVPVVNGRGLAGARGAGLEIDLADPRQREHLPRELSDVLPGHGLVNLAEAQAVARLLETWPAHDAPASLAVVALYPAQAELLRHLLGRAVTVATPGAVRHREFDTVVVSLTRSHSHRAVAFGAQPLGIWEALSRATRRAVLVGDPGTLARRAYWDGLVDHLGPAATRWERAWVSALLDLHFGPREGSRS